MSPEPHITLNGDESVACPYGDQHGTPSEIVDHLRRDHHEHPQDPSAAKVASYFGDMGDLDTAGRIWAAMDELIIEGIVGRLSVIPTPAGDLRPGEKIATLVTESTGGKVTRFKNLIVMPNRYPGVSTEKLWSGPFEVLFRQGYNTRRVQYRAIKEIVR